MVPKYITLLSDFGSKSNYPAQMKAVALNITDAHIYDITHDIQPQNIIEGAFVLKTTAPFFPTGTIHVAVVDPGVGTKRQGLIITTKTQIFIGPDNGLLIPAAQEIGQIQAYTITNEKYMRHPRSTTFDGRDVFAPIAAYISKGIPFEEFGTKTSSYIPLDFEKPEQNTISIHGKILYIDNFGNCITNIPKNSLNTQPAPNVTVTMLIKGKQHSIPFVPAYSHVPPKKALLTVGSSDYVELAMNQGNAAEKFRLQQHDTLTIQFD